MVRGSASDNHLATSGVYQFPYVGMHSFEMLFRDSLTCCLDVEDYVEVYLT